MSDADFSYLNLTRIAIVVALAIGAHVVVLVLRYLTRRAMTARYRSSMQPKIRSVTGLFSGILIFAVYFTAMGLALNEFGVSLAAYFASTSIIGLAVGFGSQGLVQDVVMGLTVIFTDTYDVGDLVEISGQTGIVERIGMRFTALRNPMGAEVLIPNRSVVNVISYPRGYVRCFADVTIPAGKQDVGARAETVVRQLTDSLVEQYPGIFRAPAEVVGMEKTVTGRSFVRVKFRIWPGRGGPIETAFKQELVQAMKALDPGYADWMVSVNYEVDAAPPRRR